MPAGRPRKRAADSTEKKQSGLKPFPPGQSGNPTGRPKGSRNKLGEVFVADLYANWLEHGVDTIETVRAERPQDYLKVIASILPKDVNVRVNDLEELPEDELIARIRQLETIIRPFLADDGIREAGGGTGPQTAH